MLYINFDTEIQSFNKRLLKFSRFTTETPSMTFSGNSRHFGLAQILTKIESRICN